jgi:uncharacterized glyoxalase superfamily protein PhnB
MSTTSARPTEHFPWVSAYFIVKNVDTSTDFYQKAFGFSLREKVCIGEDKVAGHAEMLYKDQLIMFGLEGEYEGKKSAKAPLSSQLECPVSLYIYCENVDKFYEHALSLGAKSVEEPKDAFWGDRVCRVECPEGYRWSFATHLGVPCDKTKK